MTRHRVFFSLQYMKCESSHFLAILDYSRGKLHMSRFSQNARYRAHLVNGGWNLEKNAHSYESLYKSQFYLIRIKVEAFS